MINVYGAFMEKEMSNSNFIRGDYALLTWIIGKENKAYCIVEKVVGDVIYFRIIKDLDFNEEGKLYYIPIHSDEIIIKKKTKQEIMAELL